MGSPYTKTVSYHSVHMTAFPVKYILKQEFAWELGTTSRVSTSRYQKSCNKPVNLCLLSTYRGKRELDGKRAKLACNTCFPARANISKLSIDLYNTMFVTCLSSLAQLPMCTGQLQRDIHYFFQGCLWNTSAQFLGHLFYRMMAHNCNKFHYQLHKLFTIEGNNSLVWSLNSEGFSHKMLCPKYLFKFNKMGNLWLPEC